MFERLKDNAVEMQLREIASLTNKEMPMMADEVTRTDSVEALGGRKVRYNNTLIGEDYLAENMTMELVNEIKNILKPTFIQSLKSTPETQWFIQNSVVIVYKFFDSAHNELFEIEIGPADYK